MRVAGVLGKILLAVSLVLLTFEVSFRLAGALLPVDRGDQALSREHVPILCVGDSHTWGLGAGYPRQMAKVLAERSERYRVINLGIPGANTAQVRERIEGYLDRFQPAFVAFWVGLNNRWNFASRDLWAESGVAPGTWFDSLMSRSKIVKFIKVWREQSFLQQAYADSEVYVRPLKEYTHAGGPKHRQVVFGQEDEFVPVRGPNDEHLTPEEHKQVTADDMQWILERVRERGIPAVVVTYPLPDVGSLSANWGIRRAAERTGTPVVDANEAARRLRDRSAALGEEPPPFFDKSVHPTQIVYDEVGNMIVESMDRGGHLRLGESIEAGMP